MFVPSVFLITLAHAEEPAPPVSDPPPVEAQPGPGGHFRWGVGGSVGSFFPDPNPVCFGAEGRLGYALNDRVSVYGSFGGYGGIGFRASVDETSASAGLSTVSYSYVAANADLLTGPIVVGGGLGVGRGGWSTVSGSVSGGGAGQQSISAAGYLPQVSGRVGLMGGKTEPDTGKRHGVLFALDVRMSAAPGATTVTQTAGTDGVAQSITTQKTAVGVAPMLILSYESR